MNRLLVISLALIALLLPTLATAHDLGDSSSVSIESKISMNNAEPVAWEEVRGLASCVQAGLVSQGRKGTYTLTLYTLMDRAGVMSIVKGSIVLSGEDGITTQYARKEYGDEPRKTYSDLVSPASDLFESICETLTRTKIAFEPVE